MTRIVAGAARGRTLKVPPTGTRPTTDRVREALFSSLDHVVDFDGLRVLDLFAGSGALGLEALSRGAAEVLLVDDAARATAVIEGNVRALGLPGARVVRRDCLRLGAAAGSFDLVFLDPPYELAEEALTGVLAALAEGWLADGAVVVVERSRRGPAPVWPAGYRPEWERQFADTVVRRALWYGSSRDSDQEDCDA